MCVDYVVVAYFVKVVVDTDHQTMHVCFSRSAPTADDSLEDAMYHLPEDKGDKPSHRRARVGIVYVSAVVARPYSFRVFNYLNTIHSTKFSISL